ncbi:MAG: VOC family protein [Verrucomicrobia bacterium]|nr:VOC family protein [Verrucomicrobiota bacterium]
MKPKFTGVPFFVYPVRSVARARRFYTGVLGLTEGARWKNMWMEFELGDHVIAVSTAMEDCKPGARGGAVALETDRFEEVVAHLRKHRVKFLFGPTDTGVCDFARFTDPDGNHLVLHRLHRTHRKK